MTLTKSQRLCKIFGLKDVDFLQPENFVKLMETKMPKFYWLSSSVTMMQFLYGTFESDEFKNRSTILTSLLEVLLGASYKTIGGKYGRDEEFFVTAEEKQAIIKAIKKQTWTTANEDNK